MTLHACYSFYLSSSLFDHSRWKLFRTEDFIIVLTTGNKPFLSIFFTIFKKWLRNYLRRKRQLCVYIRLREAATNLTCMYWQRLRLVLKTCAFIVQVEAHRSDVNAVRFIDDSNALLASGSDDGLVLVWDRRALNEAQPKPVGTFAGHKSGITFVHSRVWMKSSKIVRLSLFIVDGFTVFDFQL